MAAQLASYLAGASSRSLLLLLSPGAVPLRLAPSLPLNRGSRSRCWSPRRAREGLGSGRNFAYIRATTATGDLSAGAETEVIVNVDEDKAKKIALELLACPVCYQPLSRDGVPGINQRAISRSVFQCLRCKKTFSNKDVYLDLTIIADAQVYSDAKTTGVELFRNPLVSFAYERGWRQLFQVYGFPGPDEEVKMAIEYLKPAYGGVLLDVSCGSGLYTRRLANLSLFSAVIALDFSESMLRQTYEYIKSDSTLLDKEIALVRADVGRMPFPTSSIDSVISGAALHCWPSASAGVAEISRILRPGGVFVATTFLLDYAPVPWQLFQALIPKPDPRLWKAAELEDLLRICGLVNYQQIKMAGFIMIAAQKPS